MRTFLTISAGDSPGNAVPIFALEDWQIVLEVLRAIEARLAPKVRRRRQAERSKASGEVGR